MSVMRVTRPTSPPAHGPVRAFEKEAAAAEPGAVRERRATAWRFGVSELLARRPDLTGVYEPADFAAEAVRWSV